MKVNININNSVKFKLTPEGEAFIKKLNTTNPIYMRFPIFTAIDKDIEGYFRTELWCFMNIFGPKMIMGIGSLIESNTLIIDTDT